MIPLIEKHHDEIALLCQKYRVKRLDIFGSATRLDFNQENSDLDFLVQFTDLNIDNAADRYLGLLVDLEDLFGKEIDLVSYQAIRNPYFKEVVDKTRVPLYAA